MERRGEERRGEDISGEERRGYKWRGEERIVRSDMVMITFHSISNSKYCSQKP